MGQVFAFISSRGMLGKNNGRLQTVGSFIVSKVDIYQGYTFIADELRGWEL
jgi:hypothetical protein